MQFKEVIQFYSIWKPSWEGGVWPTVVRIVRLYPAAAGIPESSWKPPLMYQSSSTFQHQSSSDLWWGRRGRRCTCRGRQRPGSRSHNSKRCWNQTSAFAEKTKGQNLTKKIFVDNPAMAKATRSVKVVIVIATPACSITWHLNCHSSNQSLYYHLPGPSSHRGAKASPPLWDSPRWQPEQTCHQCPILGRIQWQWQLWLTNLDRGKWRGLTVQKAWGQRENQE